MVPATLAPFSKDCYSFLTPFLAMPGFWELLYRQSLPYSFDKYSWINTVTKLMGHLAELSRVINCAKFSTTSIGPGLSHLLHRSETKKKCHTTMHKSRYMFFRKSECIICTLACLIILMLAMEGGCTPLPMFTPPSATPRWGTFFKTKLFIDFSFLLQMFDKECARGNAPCPSSPRAPPPSVTEGVAADKLKPSGSQQSTTSQPPA